MYDIISVGAASVDILITSKSISVKNDFLSLPYAAKAEIDQSFICSGGGATNSAVSFSRLGLKAACVSLIGNDPLTEYISRDLKTEKVTTALIAKNKNDTTDHSIILIAPDGGRTILTNRGSTCLEENNIPWDRLKTKWLYFTSLEGNLDLLEKLIGFALENNIKVSLNPGARELSQRKLLIPLLKHVDFLLLNLVESETLTQSQFRAKDFWTKLISYGSKTIAVTNGRDGAYVYSSGLHLYSPVINSHPVDETGAGDSFGSAFVAALNYNLLPEEAIFWGVKNSASVVSRLGAKSGLLTYKQMVQKPTRLPKLVTSRS